MFVLCVFIATTKMVLTGMYLTIFSFDIFVLFDICLLVV